MSNPKIAPTREFSPAGIPKASIPKSETTSTHRPAGGHVHDAVISEEHAGVVHKKTDPAKPIANAKTPPLSKKAIPASSIAERLRARLKEGG